MPTEKHPSLRDRIIRWGICLLPAGALPGFGLAGLDGRDRSDPLVIVFTWLVVAWFALGMALMVLVILGPLDKRMVGMNVLALTGGAGSKYTAMPPPDYSGLAPAHIVGIFAAMGIVVVILLYALSRIGRRPGRPPKLHK